VRRSSIPDSISESEETPSDEDLPPPLNPDFPIPGEEAGYEEDEWEAVVVEEEIPICAVLDGLDPFPAWGASSAVLLALEEGEALEEQIGL
jgi:hypothetical protein